MNKLTLRETNELHSMDIVQKEYQQMQKQVVQNIIDCEEKTIKEVLRQLLKREPTIEDAKKCTRLFYEHNDNEYNFAYDGVVLGTIKRDFPITIGSDNTKFNVTFTPNKTFK